MSDSGRVEPGLVSVVVPVYNAASTLNEQFEALSGQSYAGPWEVIVADNGSKDGSQVLVQSWQGRLPRLRLADASARRGTSFARNAGVRESCGELLLFCDQDDIVCPDWVAAMTCALGQYDAVGGALERQSLNGEVALAARPLKPCDGLLDSFGYLPYTPYANAGLRRELWSRLGGFDEDYPYGSDDAVFFWRAQLSGATLGFAPDAVVHYRLRSEPAAIARQAYGYGRSHPQLFREFRAAGMPPSSLARTVREWAWIIAHSPALLGARPVCAAWLYRAAMRWGRLVGSIESRTAYL